MPCEFCGQYIEHHPRCPLYEKEKFDYNCSICGCGIYEGEEYLENNDGKFAHLNCIDTNRELLEFIEYEVKVM